MPQQTRVRHTRAEVIQRAQREFDTLDALLKRLTAADWARPVPRPETKDPWTVKDALVHIVYWKSHTARAIRGERRPAELRGLDVTQINARLYRDWRERSVDEVLAWHEAIHTQVLETLANKPDGWYASTERGPDWPADLDGHSAAHRRKDIQAALDGHS